MQNPKSARLTRRRFLAQTGTAALGGVAVGCQRGGKKDVASSPDRPNIILLLTDDQRWDALGCMGNPHIQTPNCDALAENGFLFTNNFCTTSICMASRASILTGLYTRSHGVDLFSKTLDSSTFASSYPATLRRAGYRVGFVGKWGLGGELPKDEFDWFEGFKGQGHYFQEIDGEKVHLTRLMGDNAETFLQSCDAQQPFCLAVGFKASHVQDQDPRQYLYDPAYEEMYADHVFPEPPNASDADYAKLPPFLRDSEGRKRWKVRFPTPEKFQESMRGYYRLIAGVDEVVGRIRKQLRKQNADKNTVIVLTSDNGLYLGARGLAGKWFMHEESIRTPLIVFDPRIPRNRRGQERDEMTLNIDIAPTILDLAGVPVPASVQGRSLCPLLSAKPVPWRDEWFYEHLFEHPRIPMSEGVRTLDWKYTRYPEKGAEYDELYDLAEDPLEAKNLAGEPAYAARLQALRKRRDRWVQQLEAWKPDGSTPWCDPS